jgi:hypothetical protein
LPVYIIDTGNTRKNQIEYEEVALQSVRNVVLATAWVLHGSDVLQIFADLEVATLILVQEAEAALFDG